MLHLLWIFSILPPLLLLTTTFPWIMLLPNFCSFFRPGGQPQIQHFDFLTTHDAVIDDNKPHFLRLFANWVESWESTQMQGSSRFTLTKQTLRCNTCLLDDLLNEGYTYILTSRLQSDPSERHFSKYHQMSGGRFFVALREIQSAEKILQMKSLAKAGFQFWKKNLQPDEENVDITSILIFISNEVNWVKIVQGNLLDIGT